MAAVEGGEGLRVEGGLGTLVAVGVRGARGFWGAGVRGALAAPPLPKTPRSQHA